MWCRCGQFRNVSERQREKKREKGERKREKGERKREKKSPPHPEISVSVRSHSPSAGRESPYIVSGMNNKIQNHLAFLPLSRKSDKVMVCGTWYPDFLGFYCMRLIHGIRRALTSGFHFLSVFLIFLSEKFQVSSFTLHVTPLKIEEAKTAQRHLHCVAIIPQHPITLHYTIQA